MAHRRQGYRFDNDYTPDRLISAREAWKIVKTIPVGVEMVGEHRVLNLDKAKEYLDKANSFAVMNCICKMNKGNCNAPRDVCIAMDKAAETALTQDSFKKRDPRSITREEAYGVLERSHEAGLVHMALAIRADYVNAICSCCSCCCAILGSVLRFGLFPQLITSDTRSLTDMSKCTDCGICVERCQFGARQMVNGSMAVDLRLCMGCGLCVTKCPTQAIKLVAKA